MTSSAREAGAPVAILGSGAAGAILARLLRARGRPVALIERGRHPRFALGESSTPLAAICLERLAETHGLPDLAALATYGRWTARLGHLRRGLKRGFGFYGHAPGRRWANGARNESRLLVAASPDDEVADAHWMRSDVDAHLVERAVEEGVELLDELALDTLERRGARWRLEGTRRGRRLSIDASFVVDATGGAAWVARQLGIARRTPGTWPSGMPATGLVYGHFDGAGSFAEAARAGGAELPAGPYPEERAAIHHLLEEGWMYVLPFDDGRVSAGLVLDLAHRDVAAILRLPPERAWRAVLDRYPTLAEQFAPARAARPVAAVAGLQHRHERAAGHGWALLPHTYFFASPMFSTGIAWSLVAAERLAGILAPVREPRGGDRPAALATYDALLATEADFLEELVAPAYALRRDFDAFAAWTYVYFAAASYTEARQRLEPAPGPGGWAGEGFLGSTDPEIRRAARAAHEVLRLERTARPAGVEAEGGKPASPASDPARAARLEGRVRAVLARRNAAGLADPARHRSYPVDPEALVAAAGLFGRSAEEMRAALPRLRGAG